MVRHAVQNACPRIYRHPGPTASCIPRLRRSVTGHPSNRLVPLLRLLLAGEGKQRRVPIEDAAIVMASLLLTRSTGASGYPAPVNPRVLTLEEKINLGGEIQPTYALVAPDLGEELTSSAQRDLAIVLCAARAKAWRHRRKIPPAPPVSRETFAAGQPPSVTAVTAVAL